MMKSKVIFFLMGFMCLGAYSDKSGEKGNWSYKEDLSYLEHFISKYQGLQDVALGSFKYVINTNTYKQLRNHMTDSPNLTGIIYYEINVNENHFLIAVFSKQNQGIVATVFDDKSNFIKEYLMSELKPTTQPVPNQGLLISDGYIQLRVDIDNGVVIKRAVNVVDELAGETLIERVHLN